MQAEDPFLIYQNWVSRQRPLGQSDHHVVPRTRKRELLEARRYVGGHNGDDRWNLLTLPHYRHMLWHQVFGIYTPWEVVIRITTKEIFSHWGLWQGMGWLILFGDLSPKASGLLVARNKRSLREACLEAIDRERAINIVLYNWSTEPVTDYSYQKLKKHFY